MTFNQEQQEVIQASGGYHLVLAPPGCGKTAVLAERIVWAHKHGVPFSEMACLTFTNRASRGMRERINERLSQAEGLDELFVGNVHRFCSQYLFQRGIVAEQATVIDTDTSFSILADILAEDELQVLGDVKHRQRYSKIVNLQHLMYQCAHHYDGSLMVHRDALPPVLLKELCMAFSVEYTQEAAIDFYTHADFYQSQDTLLSQDARQLLRAMEAARQYEIYKQRNDLLDFEDLLLRTYDSMKNSQATEGLPDRYSWLQIDEVQDLNPLQMAIVDLFTAPDATVVYLGDAQQAIFSFMGAKTDTLEMLRKRCGEQGFHNFHHNYRSPKYLLDVFNTYGQEQLGIHPKFLPTAGDCLSDNDVPNEIPPGSLVLSDSENNIDEVNLVARMVRRLYDAYPDETTAVVVAFNSDADEVSAALSDVPHFKVSGTDLFSLPDVRLLLAHLSVLTMEQNFIAWSVLFRGLRVYSSQSAARQFVRALIERAISPADLLTYDGSTYLAEFVKAYQECDFIVFDTETTGLSVFEDDVVQIAAVRVRQGRVVDELNIFIETDREIPPMLGDVPNPLVEEYAHHRHLSHDEAFRRFSEFSRDAEILGHNATYDYQIMEHNMQRYSPSLSMHVLWPRYFDSLKMIRLLRPRLQSYKLKNLLTTLGLEGQNSHLANDDILATLSLVNYCFDEASPMIAEQIRFLARHRQATDSFRRLYQDLYFQHSNLLFVQQKQPALSEAIRDAYSYFREIGRVGEIAKLHYIIRYIEQDMLTPESGSSLAEQLAHHMVDLSTLKEADLCGASSITDRVFVSTVHKAKGLEFDNVIVFDVVDGKYPTSYGDKETAGSEEARKFYVAISRARRRLIVTYCNNAVTPWGRWYSKQLSPYMASIRKYF